MLIFANFFCSYPFMKLSDGSCVMISMESSNWTDARNYCKSYGGDLITLDSSTKTTAVMAYAAILGIPKGNIPFFHHTCLNWSCLHIFQCKDYHTSSLVTSVTT